MRQFKRKITDVEYKLRLLASVDALHMAARDQLWPFMARLDLMDYVPMCLLTDELIRSGALARGKGALKDTLYVTDVGREYLRLFGSRMPSGDRERIAAAAPEYERAMSTKRQLGAVYELADNDMRRVRCTFQEGDVPTLLLRVETPHDKIARAAASHFEDVVPDLLRELYTLKTDADAPMPCVYDDMEEALQAVKRDAPVLCAHGKLEHSAVVWLSGDLARYIVALLLPTADAAARWAQAAKRSSDSIVKRLTSSFMMGEGLMG